MVSKTKQLVGTLAIIPAGYAAYLQFRKKPEGQTEKEKSDESTKLAASWLIGVGMIAYYFLG